MANIFETAREKQEYNKVVNGIESVDGLVETLSGPGPFTFFVPTDLAFDQLSSDKQDTLLTDPGKTECYELLQADPKTFRRWLKKAGIYELVKSQVSKADDRVKYLTQEQLEEIAELHDRQDLLATRETFQDEELGSLESALEPPALETDREEQAEEDLPPHPEKKKDLHSSKKASKKVAIKPGTYKLIVDQLDELQQQQKETSYLAQAAQQSLEQQEQAYQQAQALLHASTYEKIAAMEKAIQLQHAQQNELATVLGNQLGQFDQYKIAITTEDDKIQQHIRSLEELVAQCQHSMDRSLKALRNEMALQKEQVYAALIQTQQEIEAKLVQQQNEHKVEIHTLGEQVNGHIITLMERLDITTEQIQKGLSDEIEARKLLAKQVSTLSLNRQSTNNRRTTPAKSISQPATEKTEHE